MKAYQVIRQVDTAGEFGDNYIRRIPKEIYLSEEKAKEACKNATDIFIPDYYGSETGKTFKSHIYKEIEIIE